MKRLAGLVLALAFLFVFPGAAMAEEDCGAEGAILIEASSGRVLMEQDADKRLPMASTTKIMTALVAIERGDPEELIKIPDAAVGTEGSSMYLAKGESLSLLDLLYGLMLTSGNDAAVAIAIHLAGSIPDFAALMNEKARALGCEDTNFVTPNGLHDDAHYTTARDLAAITAAAMQEPLFRKIVSTTYHQTTTGDRIRTLKNKNKTLWQFDGGCGVKTGYTKRAGKCLVFSAERGDLLLIGVVLNAPKMWDSAFSILDEGFDTVKLERFLVTGQQVKRIAVSEGTKKELPVFVKDDILYPVKLDESDVAALTITAPNTVPAPVRAGETVGSVTLYINGEDVATTALIAGESVEKSTLFGRIGEWLDGLLG